MDSKIMAPLMGLELLGLLLGRQKSGPGKSGPEQPRKGRTLSDYLAQLAQFLLGKLLGSRPNKGCRCGLATEPR
jgi:hypothetical protein